MKNYRTPRTIAECNFDTGYPTAYISKTDAVLGWCLAGAIGIGLGLFLAFNI